MINCMVIDDQIQSLELMVDHIKQIPSLNLKCATHSAIEALHFLEKEKIDCVFLDIEMPQLTGLEFVEALKAKLGNAIPKIILVTGYSQYALSGFDHGVFDYLVKPVSFKRFKISVDRLSEAVKNAGEPRNFFFVDSDGQKIKIDFANIAYIEAAGNYISIVMPDRKIMCYRSMSSVQEILPENKFIRIHKSFIVSVDNIHSFRGNEIFINHNNTQRSMPIGITYKERLMKILRIAE
jgi:two-component system LytT family response regulator